MQKFTATFSTGEQITRKSEHEYTTAGAYVNKLTGQIKNITFSKDTASPSRMGVGQTPKDSDRKYFSSKQAFETAVQKSLELQKIWLLEVVQVTRG